MPQLTGKATIYIDGDKIEAENGARANPGGVRRPDERHGGRTYHREEEVAPYVECTVLHTKDTDVLALGNITGATVIFETDTGFKYALRQAFAQDPVEIDAGQGKSSLRLVGESFDKL